MPSPSMVLRGSPASPFVRKVRMAIDLLGQSDAVTVIEADTTDPNDDLAHQNPLGKIPTLITEAGEAIYDSAVIVAYLNDRFAGTLIPTGPDRWTILTREALADGIAEAGLLQVYEERFRPAEKRHAGWVDRQAEKVVRGLAALEAEAGTYRGSPTVADIAVAAMLGYLDLRFAGAWRTQHPKLVAWLTDFDAAVPAFASTAPPAA